MNQDTALSPKMQGDSAHFAYEIGQPLVKVDRAFSPCQLRRGARGVEPAPSLRSVAIAQRLWCNGRTMASERTFRPWTPVLAAACAAAAYGLCCLAAPRPGALGAGALLWSLKGVCGLVVLAWLPGLPLAYAVLPRGRVRCFDLAAASFGLGLLASVALTVAAKALTPRLTPGLYWALTLGCTSAGLLLVGKRVAATRALKPAASTAVWSAAGGAVLLGCTLSTGSFRLVDEDRYWPIDLYPQVASMDFTAALDRVRIRFQDASGPHDAGSWHLTSQGASLLLQNDRAHPVTGALRLLVEVHGEAKLELAAPGQPPHTLYAHPRFQLKRHPRNYPPPNFLVETRVRAAPGTSTVKLTLQPWPRADHPVHATIVDVTTTSREVFWARFRSRYLLANTGDTREQISLARSLLHEPFPRSYSFNGSVFDAGGYTISNLPLPYYLYSFALVLLGDGTASLHLLYLAALVALYLTLCTLVRTRLRDNRGRAQLVAFFPVLAYATLMRFMVESLYVHTLLTLFVLLALHFLRQRHARLWGLFAVCVLLTKGGGVALVLLVALRACFRPTRGLRLGATAYAAGLAAAVAAGLLLLAGALTGSLDQWLELAVGKDYAGRFGMLGAIARGDTAALSGLFHAGWDLTARVLLASCLLPVVLRLPGKPPGADRGIARPRHAAARTPRRDREALWLFASGLAFHLVVCSSDLVWGRLHSYVHPLNYFTPAAVLWAAAGGQSLLRRPGTRWVVAACALGLACVAACRVYVAGYAEHLVGPGAAQHEDFSLAVNDYLIRRGASLAGSSRGDDWELAQAYLTEATMPRFFAPRPTPKMRDQAASAYYYLALLHHKRGDTDKARQAARRALEARPGHGPTEAWLRSLAQD